jgi:hypothetical protein
MSSSADRPPMKVIQVTYLVEVQADATEDQITTMIDNAAVQFHEPADADGEDADFTTGTTTVYWSDHHPRTTR